MLKLPALFVLALPLLVSAGIFPKDSHVKMLDPKSFKKVMKKDETSIVAFVAPWCGHCQKMAPEYAKAAKGLNPLVPAYAIDCDEEKNKPLCGEQGVKGFPTVKVFPRGNKVAPITYEGERTSSGFFDFTSRRIPNKNKKLYKVEEIKPWIEKTTSKPRALLLNKGKKMPLLWSVLAHKFEGKIDFATFFDMKGKGHKSLGYEWKEKSKLLLFAEDSSEVFEYDGLLKLEPLSEFFSNVLSGEQSLKPANEAGAPEPTPAGEEPPVETAEATKETPQAAVTEEPETSSIQPEPPVKTKTAKKEEEPVQEVPIKTYESAEELFNMMNEEVPKEQPAKDEL